MNNNRHIVGAVGEELAARFLVKRKFVVIERNYRKKWGEIDIIARNNKTLHFIEVKTVSRSFTTSSKHIQKINSGEISYEKNESVIRVTDTYRPEDNIHPQKLKRLSRAVQSYLLDRNVSDETTWKFDVVTVLLDLEHKRARVKYMGDVIL